MHAQQQIQHHFDQRAANYDNWWTTIVGEHELRQIRPWVPAGAHVLDYGCGTGRVTLDCLSRGCVTTAFDISANMLDLAAERAHRNQFRGEFVAAEQQLAGRRWPVITCVGVLDYYPQPESLLRRLLRYLAPGGRMVVTFPNALSPLGQLYGLASHLTLHATPRTPAFVHRTARQAGLRVEHMRCAFPALWPLGHTLVAALRP